LAEELGRPVYVGWTRVFLSEPVEEVEEEQEGVEEVRQEWEEEGVELPVWARMVVAWVDRLAQGRGLRLADVQMIVGEVKQELAARRW
jgi:methionine synthase I (cobalamin-dependent)